MDNDGLLQRFQLLIYPDEHAKWKLIDRVPNLQAKNRVGNIFYKLAKANFEEYGATKETNDRFAYFRFNSDAQDLFYHWLSDLEREKLNTDDQPILLEHLSKYRSLVPSLALIFHLIEVVDGKVSDKISFNSTMLAIAWSNYLETHARRIYGMVNNVGKDAAKKLSKKIQEGALQSPFSVRDVYRKEWSLLEEKSFVQKACDELADAGWLRQEIQSHEVGRPKLPIYTINPKLKIQSHTEENFF